jgi:ubiquinol-cytochrome c reductase cytochrome c1 subunit
MRASLLVVLLTVVAGIAFPAFAEEAAGVVPAPINTNDRASLQRGAKVFVNYCLNCHSAQYMRYSRLQDIGLTEPEIKDNLIFSGQKVGETMTVALQKADAKVWLGVNPPDLSVIARSRGADWLYSYLRSFYRDDSRPTGWNNLVFPAVGMPHVLWKLQGVQALEEAPKPAAKAEGKEEKEAAEAPKKLVLAEPGKLSPRDYDILVADLVNYLVFMGEPARATRIQTGILVLFYLVPLFFLALFLKKEFWKDVH